MGLFNFMKHEKSYNSKAKLYQYDTLEHINAIPVPTKPFKLKCDFTESVEYVLQRKATEHKKAGNLNLAIACLKKSNSIMPFSEMHYSEKDYKRLAEYLKIAGMFEEARIEEEKIEKKYSINKTVQNVLQRDSKRAENLGDGLLWVMRGHCICGECAKYHDRIYTVNGIDNRYPPISLYKEHLSTKTCSCFLSTGTFYPNITHMNGLGEKDPIEYSNRPFVDDRSEADKRDYEEKLLKLNTEEKNKKDFDWIREHLPDIAPKSLNGYVRMKNSNSTNYRKIVESAKAKNYDI